jgi:hypothetical protein
VTEITDEAKSEAEILACKEAMASHPKEARTLRIGIAGPRALNEQQLSSGLIALCNVLLTICAELGSFIQNKQTTQKHKDIKQYKLPTLRLTSSLAIGADRLAMTREVSASLQAKAKLEYAAVLPFLLQDCKKGMYEASRNKIENESDWLALNTFIEQIKRQPAPSLIELEGDTRSAETRDKAHFKCAELLVKNIDVLIVFTKESKFQLPSHQLAGTNTTLRLAQESGRPIIQIVLPLEEKEAEFRIHPSSRFILSEESEIFSIDKLKRLLLR